MKRALAGLIIIFALGVSQLIPHQVKPVHVPKPVAVSAPIYAVDPTLIQMGSEVGIPQSALIQTHAHFGDASATCNTPGSRGCFSKGEITLNPTADTPQARADLAHEYLHYVWSKTTADQKATTSEQVWNFYLANKTAFDPRMKFYTDQGLNQEQLTNELHSIEGTEISDSRLPTPLLDHYQSLLPNRSALPSYY